MSQFVFLRANGGRFFDAAVRAEAAVHADPRTACFYARRALELAVAWVNGPPYAVEEVVFDENELLGCLRTEAELLGDGEDE